MRFLARYAFLASLLGAMLSSALAQSPQKQNTGVITGRVTYGEKAAPNVAVALFPADRMIERSSIMKVTTDYEGRYRMSNVPAGRFSVVVVAPAYVMPSQSTFGEPGKNVNLAEGETVEKIDFSLVKGGVITGRVTTSDGAPIIGERVQLHVAGAPTDGRMRLPNSNQFMYETDDRGVYRLFGLAPGQYTLSIGESPEGGAVRFGFGGRSYYARTFHPNVTEEAKAAVIEVAEGSEATNVDITLSNKSNSFTATGRITDESGKPVVGVRVGNGAILKEGNQMGAFGWGSVSDANGNFRLDGLTPGRYAAFVWDEDNSKEGYSEPVTFEVRDANVSGLELKLRRGGSISGLVVIEGTNDRAVLAKLTQLLLVASIEREGLAVPTYPNSKVAADGSFRITGLQGGKARLFLSNYPPIPGFTLARIERDGTPQREIEVASGTQVTGIRVIIEYGTGTVRGVIKIENGPLPEAARLYVSARRKGDTGQPNRGAQVDARGRFLLEGMATGEFELTLRTFIPGGTPQRRVATVKQNVTVTSGLESEVNMTVDLNATEPEGGNNE